MITEYTATYDLPSYVQGDTTDPFRVVVKNVDKINDVCITLCRGNAHSGFNLAHTVVGNSVRVHSFSTKDLQVGLYRYYIKFTMGDKVRTYLTGKLTIERGCSSC